MGSYWSLRIAGYEILTGKNYIEDSVLGLFRRSDARIVRSKRDPSSFRRYAFRTSVESLSARLDLMGFTENEARIDFEKGRRREVEAQTEWRESAGLEKMAAVMLELLAIYSFERWVSEVKVIIKERIARNYGERSHSSAREFILSVRDDDSIFGFVASDIRHLIRGSLAASSERASVELDLRDLVEGGYFEPRDDDTAAAFSASAIEYSRTSPVIVLTEGSTDYFILKSTLPLIYPHLQEFFSFLEFDASRWGGGAGSLVATVKAFVGSGIRNRIVAVFDNDTAASVALRALKAVDLPSNIAVMQLPRLRSAEGWPTIGPQAQVAHVDVNGQACSIESFLGPLVLGRAKDRMPIRWAGYDQSTSSYQGEFVDKPLLHSKFKELLPSLKANDLQKSAEWCDLRTLWAEILRTARLLTESMVTSE